MVGFEHVLGWRSGCSVLSRALCQSRRLTWWGLHSCSWEMGQVLCAIHPLHLLRLLVETSLCDAGSDSPCCPPALTTSPCSPQEPMWTWGRGWTPPCTRQPGNPAWRSLSCWQTTVLTQNAEMLTSNVPWILPRRTAKWSRRFCFGKVMLSFLLLF